MKRPTTLEGALRALAESEARLEALLTASFEAMTISIDGRVVMANRTASELLELPTGEMLGRSVSELLPPEVAQTVMARIRAGSEEPYEVSLRKRDGALMHAVVLGRNIVWDGQRARVTVMRDVTAERRAEKVLREGAERFRELANFLPVMVGEADATGRLTFINRVGLEVLGYDSDEELLGRPVLDLVAPVDRERASKNLRERLAGKSLGPMQYLDVRKDGSTFPALHYISIVEKGGQPGGVRTAVIDLTERLEAEAERERLQEQMLRSQKLESLGVLAGGIAHDFNNVLATVLGNAEVALLDLEPTAPARSAVTRIKRAALRASELVGELLAYAGKGQSQIGDVDINDLVDGMSDLLDVSTTKRAVVEQHLGAELPLVRGDAAQLRQVLMNLVSNAAEALGPEGGTVRLSGRLEPTAQSSQRELAFGHAIDDGPFVAVEVVDDGVGMDSDTLPRIFEPFFTTKFTGRGLGLAAVLGIVRAHQGAIFVQSTPGEGSQFRLLLPALSPPVSLAAIPDASAVAARGAPWHLEGTLLVVDDDPMLLEATRALVEHLGVRVLTASDGPEGIRLSEAHPEIDAVLLDWTMPRMSGRRVLEALRARRPDLPVVLTSGFDEADAATAFVGVTLSGFLHKPFRLDALVSLLRGVLPDAGEG